MKKAFSLIPDISSEAISILASSNISLDIADTNYIADTSKVVELLQKYDILIIGAKNIISKDILEHLSSHKVIATISIGTDHIANEVKNSEMISVLSIKNASVTSVAEHIFTLILTLNKRLTESNELVVEGRGKRNYLHEKPEEISNKKLGLIGAGNITKEVIKIAQIFNMEIICWTRNPEIHKELLDYNVTFKSLDEVLSESDIINVGLPLTNETRHLINKEKIALIKPTATFINTSRADIVDNIALIKKADETKTFYVGLDIDLDNYEKLFTKYRQNVIVTPHTAGFSKQAIAKMDYEIACKIKEFIEKK